MARMCDGSNNLSGVDGSSDRKLGRIYTPLGCMLAGVSNQALHMLTFEHLSYQRPGHNQAVQNVAVHASNPKLIALLTTQGFWQPQYGKIDTALNDAVIDCSLVVNHPLLRELQCQLNAFFDKQLREFDLPLAPAGTPFQQQAWKALQAIPYGETRSYKAQAAAIGKPKAMRAVALANARNPISLVIPCHRVIGSDGALRGYASGVERKAHMLALESKRQG